MAKIFNLSDLLEGCLKVLLSFTRVKKVFYWKNPGNGEKWGMRFFPIKRACFTNQNFWMNKAKPMRDGKECYQAIKFQQVMAFSWAVLAPLIALLTYFPSINLSEGGKKPFSWPVIWMHSILCWVQSSTISTFNLCTYCNFLWTSFLLSKYYFAISKCMEYSQFPNVLNIPFSHSYLIFVMI